MRKPLQLMVLLLLLLPWHKGFCNEKLIIGGLKFTEALAESDPAPFADFTTLVVPIKRAGNLIIVEAQVDSVEGNFVMDTGAPYLVLNETYFRDAPHYSEKQSGGINGEANGTFTTEVHDFNILDLHYSRLTADVTDLSAIENGRGIKILGLLGTRLFANFAVTIDLKNNLLYIQKLDKSGGIPAAEQVFHNPILTAPILYMNDILFLNGSINNKTQLFVFDTGAETNLMDFDIPRKILRSMQIISKSTLTGVGGSKFEVLYARAGNLVIGGQVFSNNHFLITNLKEMGKAYDHNIDGILGYDFFARGVFTINFVKKDFEMYIYNNQ